MPRLRFNRKNTKEAKEWMAAAEKNFTPQLNKLFAESLYEVGWMQKAAGQSRAALEINTPQETRRQDEGVRAIEVRPGPAGISTA